jgi:CheY-like chemotaxis protein
MELVHLLDRRLSVLLVDDEEIVRTATAEMIRDLGHDVVEVGSGADALARLRNGLSVDVVITDYMMPGMNGGTLARSVAKSYADVPVLLITGYTGPTEDVLHLARLAKPFGQADIAAALASLFADDEKIVRLPLR